MSHEIFGGIDAGGTTFKCGVAHADGEIIAKHRVPVTTPEETLAACLDFFRQYDLSGFGIASFGPLDIDPTSPTHGAILDTPKPGWSHVPLKQWFEAALSLPVQIQTDVNGALLAEAASGAATGYSSAAYVTIGTGIGAGILVAGELLGQRHHPEFGHIPVRKHEDDLAFDGICPFHGDCLEGLASVTALKQRWGDPVEWPIDHPGWEIVADYLAQACATLVLTLRLERIILGGGLMLAENLLPQIHAKFDAHMNGYLGKGIRDTDQLICKPHHGDDAGLRGALLLARKLPQ